MSPTTELESGLYAIHVHATQHVVSRFVAEDASLLPKPVFALGPGIKGAGFWRVEKTKDGRYILRNSQAGDPVGPWSRTTAEGTQHLYAFLKAGPIDGSVEWKISHVHTTDGKKGYIIETVLTDGSVIGWSAYGAEVADGRVHIAVKPLPATFSLPPQYFPSDVFQFVRIDRESE